MRVDDVRFTIVRLTVTLERTENLWSRRASRNTCERLLAGAVQAGQRVNLFHQDELHIFSAIFSIERLSYYFSKGCCTIEYQEVIRHPRVAARKRATKTQS